MTFLCKVLNKTDNMYLVEVDSTKISNYPLSNISKRKVLLSDTIPDNTVICVIDYEKVEGAVKVNKYCILSEPIIPSESPQELPLEELTKELIQFISDSNTYPISILQYVQSNS